jgi:hypothetical protein
MMPTCHILFGAAVGARLRRPWVAVPAALASHYLLDWIPHLDASALGPRIGWPLWPMVVVAVADFVLAWTLAAYLAHRYKLPTIVWWCGAAAILPDLVQWIPGIKDCFGTGGALLALGVFHHTFHHSLDLRGWLPGLSTQAAAIALSVWALATARPVPAPPSEGPSRDTPTAGSPRPQRSRGTLSGPAVRRPGDGD